MVKSIENSEHYKWGNNCDGWFLLKSESLSVIKERMPPGSMEKLHYHKEAQQLFFILSGVANIIIDGKSFLIKENESIHILPGLHHKIMNETEKDLFTLLISQPATKNDRIEVPNKI